MLHTKSIYFDIIYIRLHYKVIFSAHPLNIEVGHLHVCGIKKHFEIAKKKDILYFPLFPIHFNDSSMHFIKHTGTTSSTLGILLSNFRILKFLVMQFSKTTI